ncbi:MAG TPA: ATP-binding protein, partial [Candidatus Angelobacter sp.]
MSSDAKEVAHAPLNVRQIARIERVHQGFLYQHLYAVQVLLSQRTLGWQLIRIERDEDIEIKFPGIQAYVQVKKRASPLMYSDIEGSMEQFTSIRAEHQSGRRSGTPHLWLISNAPLAESLAMRLSNQAWADSVFVRTPSYTNAGGIEIPLPSATIEEQFRSCVALASQVEYSTLSPETLVWKLAAWVQLVASGAIPNHEITPAGLQPLLEQFVIQLQQFPSPPSDYRPQENEPPFVSPESIRLITGHSGSGKTAWAGEFGVHRGSGSVYFDCSALPSSAISSSLVRELAARFLAGPDERKAVLLPGAQGLQGLRLIDTYLSKKGMSPCLVLDNVQRMEGNDTTQLIEALRSFQTVLLSQPGPQLTLLEGRFNLKPHSLQGWSIATIAEEAQEAGCFANPTTCEELRTLTAGSPLFVRDVCKLAAVSFKGDVGAANESLKARLHERTTYQDLIVRDVLARLSKDAATAAALLSLSSISLPRQLALEVVSSAQTANTAKMAGYFRELADWHILQNSADSRVELHDAFRPTLSSILGEVSQDLVTRAREALLRGLLRDLESGGIEQYLLLARLFLETNRVDELVDMATSSAELVREYGAERAMRELVERAVDSPNLTPENHFWALDTLAFWDLADGELESAQRHVDAMTAMLQNSTLSRSARAAYAVKLILVAARRRDRNALRKAMQRCKKMGLDDEPWRIARYNYAVGLHFCGEHNRAAEITAKLGLEYFDVIGIEPKDVLFANL